MNKINEINTNDTVKIRSHYRGDAQYFGHIATVMSTCPNFHTANLHIVERFAGRDWNTHITVHMSHLEKVS